MMSSARPSSSSSLRQTGFLVITSATVYIASPLPFARPAAVAEHEEDAAHRRDEENDDHQIAHVISSARRTVQPRCQPLRRGARAAASAASARRAARPQKLRGRAGGALLLCAGELWNNRC